MKRRKRAFIASTLIGFVATLSYLSLGYSEIKQPPLRGTLALPDLRVRDIWGGTCPVCSGFDLEERFGVVAIRDVVVEVENIGKGSAPGCKLKVEFFDVAGGWFQRSVVLDVPPLEPQQGKRLTAFTGDYLFRKRTGIKAMIDSTNTVRESNEGNNSKTVYECITLFI